MRALYELTKDWQELIAGLMGAAVLIWTVFVTLTAERRRREQEVRDLLNALGVEFRQFAAAALCAHTTSRKLVREADPRAA